MLDYIYNINFEFRNSHFQILSYMSYRIPYFSFEKINRDIQVDLENAFHQVINSKWYILGKYLQDFESTFAEYIHINNAIGVGNGLDALRISLVALDLQPEDEVILPSLTFVATLLAVIQAGARPVLADIDPETYVIDPECINRLITPKTRVIIPVHIYGYPCNMNKINELAASRGIYVLEDFAQSVGSEYFGQKTGSFGTLNATSFYPTKTLGAIGDGGMITTNSSTLAEKCRILRNYGFEDDSHHTLIGYNSRLDELQAALLGMKMVYLDRWIEERKTIADNYVKLLDGLPDLVLPSYSKHIKPSYHIFPIRTKKRNALQKYLKEAGIGTKSHYNILPHLQESMKYLGYGRNSFPVAEEIAKTELSLPIYPGLSKENVDHIAENIKEFLTKDI